MKKMTCKEHADFGRDITVVSLIDHFARTGISGGSVFDALIVSAGLKAGVEQIITLNPKYFKRVYPEHAEIMIEP